MADLLRAPSLLGSSLGGRSLRKRRGRGGVVASSFTPALMQIPNTWNGTASAAGSGFTQSNTVFGSGWQERVVAAHTTAYMDRIEDDQMVIAIYGGSDFIRCGSVTYDVWLEGATASFTSADVQYWPQRGIYGVLLNLRAPTNGQNGQARLEIRYRPQNGQERVLSEVIWVNKDPFGAGYKDLHANAYWVADAANGGNDTTGLGTQAAPYETLNKALSQMTGVREGANVYVKGVVNQDTQGAQIINTYPNRIQPWPGQDYTTASIGKSTRAVNNGLFYLQARRIECKNIGIRTDTIHKWDQAAGNTAAVYLRNCVFLGSATGDLDAYGERTGFPSSYAGVTAQDFIRSSNGQINVAWDCTGQLWLLSGFNKIINTSVIFGWDAVFMGVTTGGVKNASFWGYNCIQPTPSRARFHYPTELTINTVIQNGSTTEITFVEANSELISNTFETHVLFLTGAFAGQIHRIVGSSTTTISSSTGKLVIPNLTYLSAVGGTKVRVFNIPHNDARQFAMSPGRDQAMIENLYFQNSKVIADWLQSILVQVGAFPLQTGVAITSTSGTTVNFSPAKNAVVGDYIRLDTGAQAGEVRRIVTGVSVSSATSVTVASVTVDSAFSVNQGAVTATVGFRASTTGTTLTLADASTYVQRGMVLHVEEGAQNDEYAIVLSGSGLTWTLSRAFTADQTNVFFSLGHSIIDMLCENTLTDKMATNTDDFGQVQVGLLHATFLHETVIGNNTTSSNFSAPYGNTYGFRNASAGFGLHDVTYRYGSYEGMQYDSSNPAVAYANFPQWGLTIDRCNFQRQTPTNATNSTNVTPTYDARGSLTSGYVPTGAVQTINAVTAPFDIRGTRRVIGHKVGAVAA